MIVCEQKEKKWYSSQPDLWDISRIYKNDDDIENAKWASAWCLGRHIGKIRFFINGEEYRPRFADVFRIEKDILGIIKDQRQNPDLTIKDEDLMI